MFPIQSFKYPNGKFGAYVYKSGYQSTNAMFGRPIAPFINRHRLDSDEGRSILLFPVRHPVDRFTSGVNTVRKNRKYSEHSVDQLITMLEENTFRNLHFMDISTVLRNACLCFDDIHLYKFPDHYNQMLADGGYNGEIPHKNKSVKKLILTDSQQKRVEEYYKTDIAIFNSIKEAGQKFLFFKL